MKIVYSYNAIFPEVIYRELTLLHAPLQIVI